MDPRSYVAYDISAEDDGTENYIIPSFFTRSPCVFLDGGLMKLSIYRLTKPVSIFEHVSLITVPTVSGMVGFLPDHMEFMAALKEGEVEVKLHDGIHKIPIEKGYVNFKDNECKIFISHN